MHAPLGLRRVLFIETDFLAHTDFSSVLIGILFASMHREIIPFIPQKKNTIP
jgi:hypothetical protein